MSSAMIMIIIAMYAALTLDKKVNKTEDNAEQ